MLRLLVIGIAATALFFPAYGALHPLLDADVAAGAAVLLTYIGFPAVILKMWKVYPPMTAVPVDPDDPIMSEYIQRSMGEFDRFRKGLAEAKKDGFVKYPIETADGATEHVWGLAHYIDGEHVVVSLINEPIGDLPSGESEDRRSRLPVSRLEDWMLVDGEGHCEGGYTHLALAKIYHRLHGKVPKKYLEDLEAFIDIAPSEYCSLGRRARA